MAAEPTFPGRQQMPGVSFDDFEPGDYGLKGSRLRAMLPTGERIVLTADRFKWFAHTDGTLTVEPSILVGGTFHGWLYRGVWQSAVGRMFGWPTNGASV